MKKFLALMFVCAGLTAMAVTPQLNNVKVIEGKPSKTMVNKAAMPQQQVMSKQQSDKAMADYSKTLPGFFAQKNVTPDDNMLMKKAPRRVTEDALLNANPLFSAITYGYDSEGDSMALIYPVFTGFWNIDVAQGEAENEYYYYAWFTGIPNIVTVDLANNTCEMEAGVITGWHWVDTVSQGNNSYVYNDTTEYVILLDYDALVHGADWNNIPGKVYNDGSIHFEKPWCFYDLCYVKTTTVNPRTGTTVDSTTVEGLITDILDDTWFMTPNGEHAYDVMSNGQVAAHYSNDVYMYQDENTAYVWNLWGAFGFGCRNSDITINEDGTAYFPVQPIAYEDMTDYNEQYAGTYQFGDTFWTFNSDDANEEYTEDDIPGTVTPSTITWGEVLFANYFKYLANGNTYFPGLAYNPVTNNVLTWKDNENYWWMLGVTADPVISYEVTDDAVIITLTVEDGAEYLFVVDGEYAETPCSVARGAEDRTILVEAVAQAYGKDISNVVEQEILIPALESQGLRGDVNSDGEVNITDAIVLINAILNDNWAGVNIDNADVDYTGSADISDVTKLINRVLNDVWFDE